MGSAVGTSPGRLIETDASGNILHEWPEDVQSTLNILEKQFSPHGLSIDFKKKIILTSDFVVPLSILKPTTGIQKADTLRLWDLDSRKIISTITIPNVSDRKVFADKPFSNTFTGTRYPGCQVHPRKQGECCPCNVSALPNNQ